jgi:hypothetical protein
VHIVSQWKIGKKNKTWTYLLEQGLSIDELSVSLYRCHSLDPFNTRVRRWGYKVYKKAGERGCFFTMSLGHYVGVFSVGDGSKEVLN